MKEKLTMPDEEIGQAVKEQFALDVEVVDFVPIGESSWMYKATNDDDGLVAIKIQKTDKPGTDELRRQLVQQQYPYVPKLYLTLDGKAQGRLGELYVSVEDYVEHKEVRPFDSQPDDTYLANLGKALKHLHSLQAPVPEDSIIPVETFRSSYLDLAQSTLTSFMTWASNKPEVQQLVDVLESRPQDIQTIFSRSIGLGVKLAEEPQPLVLTHGDVHFGNILDSTDGSMYLVDWDDTLIALPSHDLTYFTDAQIAAISKGYGTDLLANQDELGYYRNHLMLRYLWFWLNKTMETESVSEREAVTKSVAEILNDSPYLLRALGR